ncbi:polymorphic toxin type 15 domain-containing protein [Thioclava sp. GXIMD4215]|uniref:polymorphic toxin type 15 domain-containing protein n=1 Tax=Thioclava sp. GXIMD4215 TaxID=3131928 RepID=UPI0032430CAA
MSISPEDISARSQSSAYRFVGSLDKTTMPCKGWIGVSARYTDAWATPLTNAPLRLADASGVLVDQTVKTDALPHHGLTDGDAETAPITRLGTFEYPEVERGRVSVDLPGDSGGDAEADQAMEGLGAALTAWRDTMLGALQPWVVKWNADGVMSIAEGLRDGVMSGLESWWESEADFWGSASTIAISQFQAAKSWWSRQPAFVRYIPGTWGAAYLYEKIFEGADDLSDHLSIIFDALRAFASGTVDVIERAIDSLTRLPGEIGLLFAELKAKGQDWIERMILVASETNAFEYLFHILMAVATNMTPNFLAEMAGTGAGFVLPEVLIELVLALIAALSGGTAAALLAGRMATLMAKLVKLSRSVRALGVVTSFVQGFQKVVQFVGNIGKGLHKAIRAGGEYASDQVARISHELKQYKLEIDPSTLGMNGGNIRITRKRMAQVDVKCFDVAGYAKRRAPGDEVAQQRLMKEYARQLQDQQDGLNALTVAQYQQARNDYIALGRKGISDGAAQEAARADLRSSIRTSIARSMEGSGLSARQVIKEAGVRSEAVMSHLAALHNPDMIAGGYDQISRVADAGINSSIGGSWGDYQSPTSRISQIDSAAAKMQSSPNARMNVKLEPCRK